MILRGKPEILGVKLVLIPLRPPQIPHGMAWLRTRDRVLRGRKFNSLSGGTVLYNTKVPPNKK